MPQKKSVLLEKLSTDLFKNINSVGWVKRTPFTRSVTHHSPWQKPVPDLDFLCGQKKIHNRKEKTYYPDIMPIGLQPVPKIFINLTGVFINSHYVSSISIF